MAETKVTVLDNGPLLVNGPVELVDGAGAHFKTETQCALCRCGLTDHKPFCDGSHKGQFESAPRAAESQ